VHSYVRTQERRRCAAAANETRPQLQRCPIRSPNMRGLNVLGRAATTQLQGDRQLILQDAHHMLDTCEKRMHLSLFGGFPTRFVPSLSW
jgi:hypothetical protein